MSKIQVMPDKLVNLIRAGEIVYRPSYIVKELVENSIDANSKNIIVSINTPNGISITCKDDGDGMDREDAILCFKTHSSSKLKNEYDLNHIHSLGFRGEALASISSVCKCSLHTSDGKEGTLVKTEPNKIPIASDDVLRKGSIFEIKDIFFNTPARYKYQNTPQTEIKVITDLISKIALGYPEIAFTLIIDTNTRLKTTGRGDLLETIYKIYGSKIATLLYDINIQTKDFEIKGYISKPEIYFNYNKNILTYVNNRTVYSLPIINVIKDAYKDYLPPLKFPFALLKIKSDPSLVDVNCDPSKKTVKIATEKSIEEILKKEIINILSNNKPIYTSSFPDDFLDVENKKTNNIDQNTEQLYFNDVTKIEDSSFLSNNQAKMVEEKSSSFKTTNQDTIDNSTNNDIVLDNQNYSYYSHAFDEKDYNQSFPSMHPVGQILNTYIVCDAIDCFYLIDQHAAAERINYEKTKILFENNKDRAVLLNPIIIDLTPKESLNVDNQHLTKLESIGIAAEDFGNNTLKVTEVPVFIIKNSLEDSIIDSIHSVLNDETTSLIDILHLTIANIACKRSIKANKILSLSEMEILIQNLAKCDNPANCPHGRPTLIKITKKQLENLFKRSGL